MAKNLSLSVTLSAINKATGPFRQIMQGASGMGGALRESRDQLRSLQDQQKKLTAFRDMSRQSHDTRRALMDKREELKRITGQLESTEGPTRRLTQQQEKAQKAVDKLSGEYKQNRDRVRQLARELPAGTEGARGFKEQNAALEEQIRRTNERLVKQKDALRRLGEANVGGRFNAMTGEVRRFGRNVVVAGGLAAGSIFGLANATAGLGDDVGKTAEKLGLNNAELQELRYAGERSGVATNTLDSSMIAFTKRLGEAAEGSGAAVKGYEALGLNAQALADMPVAEAMREVADRMAEIENPTRRNAVAAQLYSRAGVGLVNMLKDGSAGLDEYGEAAHATGYILGDEATAGSEDFKDALLDAQLGMKGIKNTIGAELIPAVTGLMRSFTGWVRENRGDVQAFARDFGNHVKNAVPHIIDLAKGAAAFTKTLANMVKATADAVGGFDNLAMILGGLFAAKMILSIVMFGVSLVKAGSAIAAFAMTIPKVAAAVKVLSVAFAATPIGWIVAGVAALAYGGYLLWKNWGNIGEQFKGMLTQLKEAFSDGLGAVTRLLINWTPFNAIYGVFIGLLERLGINVPEQFKTLGGAIVDGLVGGILGTIQLAIDATVNLAKALWAGFKSFLGINSPSRVFEGFGVNTVEGLIGGISGMIGALRDRVVGVASSIIGWFKRVLDWSPIETLRNAWAGVSDMFGGVWDAIQEAFSGGLLSVTRLLVDWSPLGLLWRSISGALSTLGIELPDSLSELGSSIISGIVGGITGKLGDLRDSITGAASSAVGWFKDRLGINSPSRVFAGFGNNITEGLANGIEDDAATPLKQLDGLTRRMRDAAAGLMLTAGIASPAMALDVQQPNMPEMPGLYAHIERPELPAREALQVERPTLPELGALEIQRPELPQMPGLAAQVERPELPTLDALQVERPTLPELGALEIQRPELPEMPGLYAHIERPELSSPEALQIERPTLPELGALEIQRPELPEMPGLYAHIERPELPALDALQVERPTLPELGALEIQRPELPQMPGLAAQVERPELPTLDALQVERPTLPALEALGFQWPELPQFDPLRIDTSGVQIDARPPLQSHTSQPSGGLVINGGINIEVHAAPGMDEQALARLVNEQVQRALQDAERRAQASSRRNFHDND